MNAPLPPNATAVAMISVDEICASRSNPRKTIVATYIAELADSIKSHGLIQPITVRPLSLDSLFAFNQRAHPDVVRPTYEIVVGECRWRAAKLAGLTEIPAFWRDLDDKQVLEIQVVENLQRRDVHPIEEAEGYQALMDRHGYTADALDAKIGKSRAYIYARIKLTALCRPAREEFFAGKLEASTALLIARIPGESLQKKATKEVLSGYDGQPLTYRAAKQHIQSRYTLSLKQATFKPDDATLLPVAGACSVCPKLSGNFQDLFNDIEDADVCTDPDCFEAKRQARRDQLIAHAEKHKIPVLLGEAGKVAWHGEQYAALDDEVDGDADERSYREILGDKAIVAAIIERPWGNDKERPVEEFGDYKALQKALKAAGWKAAEPKPEPTRPGEDPAAAKARQEQQAAERAERDKKDIEAEAETTARKEQLSGIMAMLKALPIISEGEIELLILTLAKAWLRWEAANFGQDDSEDLLRDHLGYTFPDEYDEPVELDRICALIDKTTVGHLLAMLFENFTRFEISVSRFDDPAKGKPILNALSSILQVDEPTKVQPKTAKAKKAKAVPAPKVAAAPSSPTPAWPFPTGAKA